MQLATVTGTADDAIEVHVEGGYVRLALYRDDELLHTVRLAPPIAGILAAALTKGERVAQKG